ncbi:MAG: bifunctional 3-(3-hydroxy-phenyl)propionate/3-hydroxycinnamic acid hydroxylase, partial [Actinobacteria bacterium]|nr:bifunctional 3-(3-hydroxy-phenyl)propionate/3-hydroxycinnamic acid hydroxylase [Actinomycetota bacterium]
DGQRALLSSLGAHLVRVVPPGTELPGTAGRIETVADLDGRYQPWLAAAGYAAAVIRPDGYVFGGVASAADLPGLLDELASKLELSR